MSQRAAWQLERLGFGDVHDFVHGKAYWLASGRPSVRIDDRPRVRDEMSSTPTAGLDDPVSSVREQLAREPDDVVVIGPNRVVHGRVSRSALVDVDPTVLTGDIMSEGPTTIRPDEPADAVRARMSKHGVTTLIVTRPTGELLGVFNARSEGDHP